MRGSGNWEIELKFEFDPARRIGSVEAEGGELRLVPLRNEARRQVAEPCSA